MAKESNNEPVVEEVAEKTETEPVKPSELETAVKAADEFKNMAQRIQAEFDNYRKRNAEAVRNARNDGIDDVVEMFFPVLDNFERGMNAVDEQAKIGMELIYKQVLAIFEKLDVKEIAALGEDFNPEYHHAIARCEDENNENKVVEVFQKGYMRKNKVLRPAMMKVAQ